MYCLFRILILATIYFHLSNRCLAINLSFQGIHQLWGDQAMDGAWGASRDSGAYRLEKGGLRLSAVKNDKSQITPAMAFKRLSNVESNWTVSTQMILQTNTPHFESGLFFGTYDKQIRVSAHRHPEGHLSVSLSKSNGERQTFTSRDAHWYNFNASFTLELAKLNQRVYGFLKLPGKETMLIGFMDWKDPLEGVRFGAYSGFWGDQEPSDDQIKFSYGELSHFEWKYQFEPGIEVDPENQIWMKIIFHDIIPAAPTKVAIAIYEAMHHSLFKFSLSSSQLNRFLPSGWHDSIPWKSFPPEDVFSRGQKSDWFDLSSLLSAPRYQGLLSIFLYNDQIEKPSLTRDSGNIDEYDLEILLSKSPQDDSIIHRIREKSKHDSLTLYLRELNSPVSKWAPQVRSFTQYTEDRYQKLIQKKARPVENKEGFFSSVDITPGIHHRIVGPEAMEKEEKIAKFLGHNTPSIYLLDPAHTSVDPWDPERKKLFKDLVSSFVKSSPLLNIPKKGSFFAILGDENQVIKIESLLKSPQGLQSFREYIKNKGYRLEDLELKNWEELLPISASEVKSSAHAKIRYETAWFLQISTHQNIKLMAETVKEIWPQQAIPVTQIYEAGFEFMPDYFLQSQIGSVERFGHHFGGETTSIIRDTYHADLFKSASRSGSSKLGCIYYVCRIGQSIGTQLTGYLALSRGFNFFHFYGYGPFAYGWEWMSDDRLSVDAFVAASKMMHMGSQFASYLNPQFQKDPQVASILSRSSDIWSGSKENSMIEVFGHQSAKEDQNKVLKGINLEGGAEGWRVERDMIHLQMNYDNIPMGVIPEEKLETDEINQYKILYCYTPNLSKKSQLKLMEWVKKGGYLYLGPRAATRDEYNRPLDLLKQLTSKEASVLYYQPKGTFAAVGTEQWRSIASFEVNQVDQLKVLDQMKLPNGKTFDVVGYRETLPFDKSTALSTYSDGTPAIVRLSVEKGQIIKSGVNLGAMLARIASPTIDQKRVIDSREMIPIAHQISKTKLYQRNFDSELSSIFTNFISLPTQLKQVQTSIRGVSATLIENAPQKTALLWVGRQTAVEMKSVIIEIFTNQKYTKATTFSGVPVKITPTITGAKIELDLSVVEAIELQP